jgi:tol-pal system beta propeller repeat protein TolB
MKPGHAVLVVAIAGSACSNDRAPLSASERRALPGTIYFISERAEPPATWRVSPDGSGEARVISGDAAAYPYGASPDKKKVAFVRSLGERDEIALADPDGKNIVAIAPAENGVSWYPAFSPDGKWILFESSRDAFRELYKVSLEDGRVVRLTNNREGNFDGAWSPDGKKIAFASSRHGRLDLFVMDADGKNQTRLTQHAGDSIKPAWSPDGKSIVFISGRDGNDNLFSITPDGREIKNLTPGKEGVESFVFSEDGGSIAYAARAADGKSKLRIVEPATGRVRELSGKSDNDSSPAWSPDGEYLVFASSVEGRSDLWIMDKEGGRRTRLTNDPRGAWLPRWIDTHAAPAASPKASEGKSRGFESMEEK